MSLFVHWPLALKPDVSSALLISYGIGITAKTLTNFPELESIEVVDISRDILELSRDVAMFREGHPLDDPRVRVHVEDGRFFLQTVDRSVDLITGEPPPPKSAGIVNLYSREYFHLLRARLAPGGLATYWLPIYQMQPDEGRAIVRAFCDAFPDCTLWTGRGFEWMLAGSRDYSGPASAEGLARLWAR